MAFDGIVVSGVVWELSGIIEGSRITKIYQAEKDEILLVCHKNGENYKLLISCSPANPRIHLQRRSKENPMVAPPFCMILRKHIQGGRINKIIQSGYDRVITLKIETYNEMGDTVVKNLIAEIMGRHSNIILTGPSGVIYDAIKHVDDRTSSIREILPARPYLPPPSQNKISPDDLESIGALISDAINTEAMRSTGAAKFLLSSISGFSPLLSKKVCRAANVDPETRLCSLTEAESSRLTDALLRVCRNIAEHSYKPFIFTEDCGLVGCQILRLSLYRNSRLGSRGFVFFGKSYA